MMKSRRTAMGVTMRDRLAGIGLVLAILGALAACSPVISAAKVVPSTTTSTVTTGPFFSFDGYGGIRIVMSRSEALAVAPYPLIEFGRNNNCSWLVDGRVQDQEGGATGAVQVTLDNTNHVLSIDTIHSL